MLMSVNVNTIGKYLKVDIILDDLFRLPTFFNIGPTRRDAHN